MPSVIGESESFYVNRKKLPYFGGHWHYHEEFELMYTIKGGGIRIVGDNMDHFHENELVFIGSNVPHLFKDDYKDDEASTDSIVLKFNNLFKGQNLFTLPEFQNIANFLKTAGRGIIFSKKTVKKVKKILIQLSKSEGAERFVHLFAVLNILANEENFQYLASEHFTLKTTNKGDDRTQKVIEYISENYNKDISLDDLAQVAFMTTNSFCRYFKKRTGKTVFQFLREFRINKACQMLINGEKTIAEICYDTGFNSFSSFNRIFKDLKNISASEYKSKYILINE
jgi:AraC-like DNA-binding protein